MDKKHSMPIVINPYSHQIKGFNLCMQNDGYGLLYDVGLGKSLSAIAVAGARYIKGQVKRLLVVCPLAVVSVWERECKNLTIPYVALPLEGKMSKRIDSLRHLKSSGLEIAIINYEGARIIQDELIKWRPDMLIVDESQKIKNHASQQSKVIHKFSAVAKYRVILTATPIGNSISDVFSQWKVIDPNIFGKSFYAFRAKYLILGGYAGKQIVGTRNMEELLERMHSKSLRVTKEDALDLPKQLFERRYCQLEERAMAIYKSLQNDCFSQLSKGEVSTTNKLTQMLRLQQCADGFLKADELGKKDFPESVSTAKLELLEDTIDEIGKQEKIVIFARFTAEIRAIERRLDKLGIKHLTLDGSTKDKGAVVKEFQENASTRVIVCQTQVGGVGITLTSASVMIFYSHSFSLIDYLQAVGRIHRINQKHRCLYIDLIAKNTIDEHIKKAIEKKENFAETVVDNWQEVCGR